MTKRRSPREPLHAVDIQPDDDLIVKSETIRLRVEKRNRALHDIQKITGKNHAYQKHMLIPHEIGFADIVFGKGVRPVQEKLEKARGSNDNAQKDRRVRRKVVTTEIAIQTVKTIAANCTEPTLFPSRADFVAAGQQYVWDQINKKQYGRMTRNAFRVACGLEMRPDNKRSRKKRKTVQEEADSHL